MVDMEMEDGEPKLVERKQALYQCLDERFVIRGERYRGQQYSQIYFTRLHHMRNILRPLVPNWKPHLPGCTDLKNNFASSLGAAGLKRRCSPRIQQSSSSDSCTRIECIQTVLGLEEGKECIVVGTIYKHMKLKPSILDEYSKERSTVPLVKPHNFMHPDDHLILEDESGRVKLTGNFLVPSTFVTGIVLAVHGKETSDGDLLVQGVLEAGLPPQKEILPGLREDKYVVLISGLSVGSRLFNPLQFQLFVDHITGHLGDENEQNIASQTVRLVIAGNSVEISQGLLGGQTLASKDQFQLSEPIKELDILLTQLAAAMPLDIMPGPKDPANFSLPQQPLNRCLFPGASVYNTFISCTNPHHFELDGIQFIGTSGQNIDDLDKYSEARDKVEFMERTLRWRHLAPTAPNTLGCYPFTDKEPFLLESCPHVYFVGNQDRFETHVLEGPEKQFARLICVPRFCETGTAVMLNMKNFECHTLSFSTDL